MSWDWLGVFKAQGSMGFKALVCFNNALLARQYWRLLQNPKSLATRIIKAKYYPSGAILEAPLYNKSSFAWRSIQRANELLKHGLI